MTDLTKVLLRRISQNGPMALTEFIETCLLHPVHGYYTQQNVFGASGDFVTAPETSQMFGELLGLCLAQSWQDQGCPDPFVLLELGPGRGSLMADLLRATSRINGFHQAMHLYLYEASKKLVDQQRKNLTGYEPLWIDSLADLPNLPLFCIANEFFDALPVHQYQRKGDAWHEQQVGIADGQLLMGLNKNPSVSPQLQARIEDTAAGDIVEISPQSQAIVAQIGNQIESYKGAALIFDYGDWRSLGDTVQAVKNHQYVDLLTTPGEADLTAHVDFEALAHCAPCAHSRLTPQGVLLERLGITPRAQALAKNLSGPAIEQHIAAHRRLTHPDEMGKVFKALALFPKAAAPPPGFQT